MPNFSEFRHDFRIFLQAFLTWGPVWGLIDLYHYRKARAHEKADRFDQRFGTETSRMVGIWDLKGTGSNQKHSTYYWPTREGEFNRMMQSIGDIDHSEFTFVDLGCGKGRATLLASTLPFKRVIGVDFSPALVEQAKQNVARYSGPRQSGVIDVIVADAAEFPMPEDNLLVYMFNPFGPQVLKKVLENLMSSLRDHPRKVLILYYHPLFAKLVREAGFQLATEGKGESFSWHVYSAG